MQDVVDPSLRLPGDHQSTLSISNSAGEFTSIESELVLSSSNGFTCCRYRERAHVHVWNWRGVNEADAVATMATR